MELTSAPFGCPGVALYAPHLSIAASSLGKKGIGKKRIDSYVMVGLSISGLGRSLVGDALFFMLL